jgi:heme-degrading monooxygenase HmoA
MTKPLSSIASLLVIRYDASQIPYAFWRMARGPAELAGVPGLVFSKLGGTGRGLGFTLAPDFERYALFGTWNSEQAWQDFLASSAFMRRIREKAREHWWALLAPLAARGFWDRESLFDCGPAGCAGPASPGGHPPGQPPGTGSLSGQPPLGRPAPLGRAGPGRYNGTRIAVLTRATIRMRSLGRFWSEVPHVTESLARAEGLLCSIGFGEWPWIRQATFSVWKSPDRFEAFAYGDANHRRVIERTRQEGWYREELFARFGLLGSGGSWNGRDPLS